MSDQNQPPADDEHGGPIGRATRIRWFNQQTPERRDEIIRDDFNKEHPTNADKRAARERYGL